MIKHLCRSRIGVGVLSAGLAVATLGGVNAFASGDGSTIQACKDRQGNLRAVSAASDCSKNETPIEWNVEGPAGPQGPIGPQGPQGPAGPQGAPGVVASTYVGTASPRVAITSTPQYVSPPVPVAVAPGQKLHVWADALIGANGNGGFGLVLSICYSETTSSALLRHGGDYVGPISMGALDQLPVSLSAIVPVGSATNVWVGMCGWANNGSGSSWFVPGNAGHTHLMVTNS